MTRSDLAAAEDYADALTTARRAKWWLFLILLLILLLQMGLFFTYRYGLHESDPTRAAKLFDRVHYAVGLADFLGIVLALMFLFDLWLIAHIMLVGRLIGISRVVSSLILSLFLVLLLFPWQGFMARAMFTDPSFKIPGVLYTWDELITEGRWHSDDWSINQLRWFRFVVMPLAAMVILLIAQLRSDRGIRMAQGESPLPAKGGASV